MQESIILKLNPESGLWLPKPSIFRISYYYNIEFLMKSDIKTFTVMTLKMDVIYTPSLHPVYVLCLKIVWKRLISAYTTLHINNSSR